MDRTSIEPAVSELTERERRELAKRHPEIRKGEAAVVISGDADVKRIVEDPMVLTLAEMICDSLDKHTEEITRIIEALLPKDFLLSRTALLHARRNTEARLAMLSAFGAYTSAEVAEMARSTAQNKAALANRWRTQGRIFSVPYQGTLRFPAFQFDQDGQPIPAVAEVLTALSNRTDWEKALWFTSASGWLGGRRPVDLLKHDPHAVVEGARREAAALVF